MIVFYSFILTFLSFGCGKSKIDGNTYGLNESTASAEKSSSLVKCDSVTLCKIMCDSPPSGGGVWIKEECEFELRKNWPNKPYCNQLNACYSKLVDESKYSK